MTLRGCGSYTRGKDSYVRPSWPEAYVFAYAATREWVAAVHQWTAEVDPTFWTRVRRYTPGKSPVAAMVHPTLTGSRP